MDVGRVVVAAALVVVAGCGQQAEPSAESPTASTVPSPDEPTGLAAAPDDTWAPWAKGVAATEVNAFTAADATITCVFDDRTSVRCDRAEGLGVDQPRPADCRGDWGDAVEAVAGRGGSLVCASDTVRGGAAEELADGEAASYGDLTCAVRDDAVQCLTPTPTGYRGFVVSSRVLVTR